MIRMSTIKRFFAILSLFATIGCTQTCSEDKSYGNPGARATPQYQLDNDRKDRDAQFTGASGPSRPPNLPSPHK